MTDAAGTLWIAATVVLLALFAGSIAFVGADSLWLAALGRSVGEHGIPAGIPFAQAPTAHWPNTLVLAELTFNALERSFGDGGLIGLQSLLVALALGVLAFDARRGGARPGPICAVLGLAFIGSLSALTVARVQMFSLIMFPAALALIRADARALGARIWWVLPLLAVWANLHGAAVLGLVLLYPYLLIDRFRAGRTAGRRSETLAVVVLAPVALCATPAGLRSIDYYHGLLTNLAAQQGEGMWAPLGTGTLDLLLIAVAALLGLLALHRREMALWETVVVLALALATIKAARDGIWLLFALVVPSALGLCARLGRRGRDWLALLPLAFAAALALLVMDVSRWSAMSPQTPPAVAQAIALAHGSPILAEDLPGERIAFAGGRIWAGNPIDAFPRSTQRLYLDFIAGRPAGALATRLPGVHVALLGAGSPPARLLGGDHRWHRVADDAGEAVYVRSGAASGSF